MCQQKNQQRGGGNSHTVKVMETILSISILPEHNIQQEIMAIRTGQQQPMTRIYAAMYIKGGKEVRVDTGVTCNAIKISDIMGTK